MSGFTSVGYFLVSLLFSVITFVLWVRFALRYFRVSSLHPSSQTINALTNRIVKPLSGMFKSSNTRANRYDWACLCVLVVVEMLKYMLITLMILGAMPSLTVILIYTLADLIIQPCNLLFYAVIIRVIISWVNPQWHNPMADLLYLVTEPMLSWARRLLPPYSGIDFSPFIVMIVLKVITLFIEASLPAHF